MEHWIGWNRNRVFIYAFCSLILLILSLTHKVEMNFSLRNIISVILYLIVSFSYISVYGITLLTGLILPTIFILCISSETKGFILSYLLKWFAWLMIPGIIIYFVLFFIDLPYLGMVTYSQDIAQTSDYGYAYNYIFMIRSFSLASGEYFERFKGPFLEPGFLGMMSAWLLFATGHNYSRKESWIILLSLILSFSLAGYVLGFLGFLFSRFTQKRFEARKFIVYLLLLLFAIFIIQNYNEGDNVFNNAIFSRLELDEDKGIVGNNRTTSVVKDMYDKMFDDLDLFLTGYNDSYIDVSDNSITGNGYTLFFVKNGLLGLLLGWSFYLYLFLSSKNKKYAFLMFIFFCACFWQRTYITWFSWLICYSYPIFINEKRILIEDDNL